jgi:hypothetical protein
VFGEKLSVSAMKAEDTLEVTKVEEKGEDTLEDTKVEDTLEDTKVEEKGEDTLGVTKGVEKGEVDEDTVQVSHPPAPNPCGKI